MNDLRERLRISSRRLEEINAFLTHPDNELINGLLDIVERYGGPDEINRKANDARKPENLMERLKDMESPYLADLDWLIEQKTKKAFVPLSEYCENLRPGGTEESIRRDTAVTLEISALQFFPWLITQARRAISRKQLMPGRFIRVRSMKEQEADRGDLMAVTAAMGILGASCVETLDTKGTDGSNIHLCGPETITGYFGGVGQPNAHPLKWVDEYLYYLTTYGVRQVLNINPGTVFLGYMLHKLGVDNTFKISVFMGNDNPFAVLWTLMGARLFSREDGTTSLEGFNFSNSVDNSTIRSSDTIRRALDLTDQVRFEHHITETWKSIVRQPYLRRNELVEVAKDVPNISAKHEGADPDIEKDREHPSDILDYFLPQKDILERGLMEAMERNYLDKHDSLNRTAAALIKAGIGVICAANIH